jgi:hypothetical protein
MHNVLLAAATASVMFLDPTTKEVVYINDK